MPTISEVRSADISEAVRSSDLRTLLFSNFPGIEIKPMGGTILRWLFQHRAGNFKMGQPLSYFNYPLTSICRARVHQIQSH